MNKTLWKPIIFISIGIMALILSIVGITLKFQDYDIVNNTLIKSHKIPRGIMDSTKLVFEVLLAKGTIASLPPIFLWHTMSLVFGWIGIVSSLGLIIYGIVGFTNMYIKYPKKLIIYMICDFVIATALFSIISVFIGTMFYKSWVIANWNLINDFVSTLY